MSGATYAALTPLDGLKTRLECVRHKFRYLARAGAGAKGLSRCPLCLGEAEVRERAAKRRLVPPNKANAKTWGTRSNRLIRPAEGVEKGPRHEPEKERRRR